MLLKGSVNIQNILTRPIEREARGMNARVMVRRELLTGQANIGLIDPEQELVESNGDVL